MKKYTITLTEYQLALIAACVEDVHRFLCGDTKLHNTTSILRNELETKRELAKLQPLVTPDLCMGSQYDWSGRACPDGPQRKMIAQTYYLYREMLHQRNLANGIENVYTSSTLRCRDSGEPIKIEWEDAR